MYAHKYVDFIRITRLILHFFNFDIIGTSSTTYIVYFTNILSLTHSNFKICFALIYKCYLFLYRTITNDN